MYPRPVALPVLLPNCVAVHAVFFDDRLALMDFSLPARLRAAVPKRRAEFIAGRLCARQALREAGASLDQDIPIGPMGAPVWPGGFVGSITHTYGLAAAVAARTRDVIALGFDIEHSIGYDAVRTLAQAIARPNELWLVTRGKPDSAMALTIVFATKEALFKCLAPLVGRYFDFLDVEVISATRNALSIRLRTDLAQEFRTGQTLDVRFAFFGDIVLAATVLATADRRPRRTHF
jgi:enterobactin synthetase component D